MNPFNTEWTLPSIELGQLKLSLGVKGLNWYDFSIQGHIFACISSEDQAVIAICLEDLLSSKTEAFKLTVVNPCHSRQIQFIVVQQLVDLLLE